MSITNNVLASLALVILMASFTSGCGLDGKKQCKSTEECLECQVAISAGSGPDKQIDCYEIGTSDMSRCHKVEQTTGSTEPWVLHEGRKGHVMYRSTHPCKDGTHIINLDCSMKLFTLVVFQEHDLPKNFCAYLRRKNDMVLYDVVVFDHKTNPYKDICKSLITIEEREQWLQVKQYMSPYSPKNVDDSTELIEKPLLNNNALPSSSGSHPEIASTISSCGIDLNKQCKPTEECLECEVPKAYGNGTERHIDCYQISTSDMSHCHKVGLDNQPIEPKILHNGRKGHVMYHSVLPCKDATHVKDLDCSMKLYSFAVFKENYLPHNYCVQLNKKKDISLYDVIILDHKTDPDNDICTSIITTKEEEDSIQIKLLTSPYSSEYVDDSSEMLDRPLENNIPLQFTLPSNLNEPIELHPERKGQGNVIYREDKLCEGAFIRSLECSMMHHKLEVYRFKDEHSKTKTRKEDTESEHELLKYCVHIRRMKDLKVYTEMPILDHKTDLDSDVCRSIEKVGETEDSLSIKYSMSPYSVEPADAITAQLNTPMETF